MSIYAAPGGPQTGLVVFGTSEPVATPVRLTAGPLSLEWNQGVARALRWRGVEVIRAIDCPIRDENWATYASTVIDEKVRTQTEGFEVVHERVIAGGALSCRLALTGRSNGFLRASVELTARESVRTNRAGFTVLHPLDGVTGSKLTVLRTDGDRTLTQFQFLISPGQVAFDIAGLVYSVRGVETEIDFAGETFEMEDQRNWSDASFKTYCRPLSLPTPYVLAAGETYRQEIQVRLKGAAKPFGNVPAGRNEHDLQLGPISERVPTVALAVDAMSVPDARECSLAQLATPRILQLRVDPDTAEAVFESARPLIRRLTQVELEIVIPQDRELDGCLAEIVDRCKRTSLPISRVLALPELYLRSYQPDGPWPGGPTPQEAYLAARRCFPNTQVGGGVLTHFAELNRCRPDVSVCDYLSHGSTAVVHAADDRSVTQSLEGLSQVCASARALTNGRDYRLGLVSIGMRSNPYGADVAPNPEQARVPMARIDPRQRGLFAAAWAIGAVAATAGHGVSSMALATLVGPFGMIYRRLSWAQPIYDESPDAVIYPLFHVVRALVQVADAPRLSLHISGEGVVGVAAATHEGHRLLIANLMEGTRVLELPSAASVRRLDEHSFKAAITDPDWLCTGEPKQSSQVSLDAFNVAFIDWSRAAS